MAIFHKIVTFLDENVGPTQILTKSFCFFVISTLLIFLPSKVFPYAFPVLYIYHKFLNTAIV
jgi:hypothetical protein